MIDIERYKLKTQNSNWSPDDVKVTLNVKLDACIVPTSNGTTFRTDTGQLIVLDDFFSEKERTELLDFITKKEWNKEHPPEEKWEKSTSDSPYAPATWGLKDNILKEFMKEDISAKLEIQSRLCKLYPDLKIIHLPSDIIQSPRSSSINPNHGTCDESGFSSSFESQAELETSSADCCPILANAAMPGDRFQWHMDADPWAFPKSLWTQTFGNYINREPGKPRLVTFLIYLCGPVNKHHSSMDNNKEGTSENAWPKEWDAETLFLDGASETGVIVRPKPYRAVLFDQDLTHRLSPPSLAARTPRYSMVWKLALIPDSGLQFTLNPIAGCNSLGVAWNLNRAEWAPATPFGSAVKIQNLVRQLHEDRGRKRRRPIEEEGREDKLQKESEEEEEKGGGERGGKEMVETDTK